MNTNHKYQSSAGHDPPNTAHKIKNQFLVSLSDKHETAAALSISTSTLKKYRLGENSSLIEGIHYYKLNSRVIRYNLELMVDWAMNRTNPIAHQRAIEAYLARLEQAQSTPRKKKRR